MRDEVAGVISKHRVFCAPMANLAGLDKLSRVGASPEGIERPAPTVSGDLATRASRTAPGGPLVRLYITRHKLESVEYIYIYSHL